MSALLSCRNHIILTWPARYLLILLEEALPFGEGLNIRRILQYGLNIALTVTQLLAASSHTKLNPCLGPSRLSPSTTPPSLLGKSIWQISVIQVAGGTAAEWKERLKQ